MDTIGIGGLFIRTSAPPARQSMVQMLVEAPQGEVRARGIVRWAAPKKGMGIEFIAMTQEDRGRLLRYLRRLSGPESSSSH